jgi:hypothetical protein
VAHQKEQYNAMLLMFLVVALALKNSHVGLTFVIAPAITEIVFPPTPNHFRVANGARTLFLLVVIPALLFVILECHVKTLFVIF